MKSTQPTEDNFPTAPVSSARITPLARAALENGIAFEDVQAYALSLNDRCGQTGSPALAKLLCEALTDAALFDTARVPMLRDVALDAALMRSAMSQGIEHARLWWLGVLS